MSLPVSIVSDRDCQQNWDSVGQRLFEPGDIKWAAYANPDPGWLVANGAAVSRIGYPDLFKKIGTTWGVGDGSTTFNLPALSGRMPMGAGTGSGLTARTLGQLLGTEAISATDLPAHTHSGTTGNNNTTIDHAHTTPYSPGGYVARADVSAELVLGSGTSLGVVYTHNNSGLADRSLAHTHSFTTDGGTGGAGTSGKVPPVAVLSCFIKF